jgi:hypothetical protein
MSVLESPTHLAAADGVLVSESPTYVEPSGGISVAEKPAHVDESDDGGYQLAEVSDDEAMSSGIVFVETAQVEADPGLHEPVVVAAEIVDESLPEIGDATEAELPFATIVPNGFSWERARRFIAFFGEELAGVQTAYQQLVQRQQELLALEQQQHETLMQLGFHRADKEDDIARCDEDIDAVKESITRLERSAARAQRELRSLERQSTAFWHQVGTLITPEKGERARQMRSELESTLRELGAKIADARRELETHQRQRETLVEPVERLRVAAEEVTSQRDTALQAIAVANEVVSQQVMETICQLPSDELNGRLEQLIALDNHNASMVACVQQLTRMLAERKQRAAESREVEAVVKEADAASRESVGQLAASIAAGFVVSHVEMQTPFRLTGSIRFQEEHSYFGGYSGASGSVSGSGGGSAEYEVQQLLWTLPTDLDKQIATFTDAWERCGQQHAEHEFVRRRLSMCDQSIAEYVDLLRSELERDFAEQGR